MLRSIVGVPIALPVAELLHELRRRIPQVQRHRIRTGAFEVLVERLPRALDGVRLRGQGQVDGRLCQRVVALRHADEVHRLLRARGQDERLWIGEADVLCGEDHQPARDEQRVFP